MVKKNWKKSILSCVLTLCMLVSLTSGLFALPVSAADVPVALGEHNTQEELDDQWVELQGMLSQIYGQWGTNTAMMPEGDWEARYSEPVNDKIPNTALLGNGDIGASADGIYGTNNNSKTVRLGKSDFWTTQGDQGSYPVTVGGVTIEAAAPIVPDPNLARRRPVLVSGVHPDNNYGNVGANITDGNESSKWVGNADGRVPNLDKGGQWAVIDLGAAKEIARYVIKNAGFASENNHNMRAWKLQYLSNDALMTAWNNDTIAAIDESAWVDVDVVADNPGDGNGRLYDKTLDVAVTARYVRLLVLIPSNDLGNGDARVHELELYEPVDDTPVDPDVPVMRDGNIALNSRIKVDSQHDNAAEHGPGMVDGVDGTKWCSQNAPLANPHWAIIDLENVYDIGSYIIKNSGINNENEHQTRAWRLEYLTDGAGNVVTTDVWEGVETLPDAQWVEFDSVENNTPDDAGDVITRGFVTPVKARYVRLVVTVADAPDDGVHTVRIHELQLFRAKNANIAPTGTASGSSTHESFTPDLSINGTIITAPDAPRTESWTSKTFADDPALWYQVEFDSAVQISRFRMVHDGGARAGENNNNAKAFKVETSLDGTNWVEVYTVANNAEGVTDVDLAQSVFAKYFRITYTLPTQHDPIDPNESRARLPQLEIYPHGASTPLFTGDEPAPIKNVNIAPTGTATASSGQNNGQGAQSVITGAPLKGDGTDGVERWYSEGGANQTFTVEFAEEVQMGSFRMVHDGGSRNLPENNPVAFTVEVSTDNANWTPVYTTSSNTANVTHENISPAVKAKYFRITYTKTVQTGDERARLHGLEIYPLAKEAPVPPPEKPPVPNEFYEKQDILNARMETTTVIGGLPLQITTWTPANANYVIQKIEIRDGFEIDSGRLRAFNFTPPGNRGGTMTLDAGVNEENNTAWASRTTASPNNNYDPVIGWRSEVMLDTKVLGGSDMSVGVMDSSNNAQSYVDFTITAGTPAYVITAVGGAGQTYVSNGNGGYDKLNPARGGVTPLQETQAMLAALDSETAIDTMIADHAAWWKDYWMQSYVKVNTDGQLDSVERYYYAAQYMLGASTRAGEQPAGLYAHWHTNDNATWNGDYHLNYNFISTWYGSASSNREEQLLPAVMALNDYLPVAQGNAEQTERDGIAGIKNITNGDDPNRPAYYPNEDTPYVKYRLEKDAEEGVTTIHPTNGIEGGSLFPVGVGPWGSAPDSGFHGEAVNGPFSAWPMIEYYNYTLDTDFLASEAFEMVKGSANFGVGWMENYGTDANGQELYRLISGYNEGSWSLNPAVELGAYKMVLENAARFARILDDAGLLSAEDKAMIEVWESVRAGMPAQPTAMSQGNDLTELALCYALAQEEYKNGVWAEMESPLPSDGNIIPLESIIPSGQVGYFSPEEELQTARNTILRFGGNAWSTINNFPKGFPVAARVKFAPSALMSALTNRINIQMQGANLRINDNAHGIEKTGAIEAVNSMLIIGDKDVVKVFPNWFNGEMNFTNPTEEKRDAEFHRLRAPGAFVISAAYDADAFNGNGGVTSLKITSEAGAQLTLASPWGEDIVVKDASGAVVPVVFGTAPNHPEEVTITFPTVKGMTYTFAPESGESYEMADAADVTFNMDPTTASVTITQLNDVDIEPIEVANGDVETLANGKYTYVATAAGQNEKLGYFTVAGVDMEVDIAMNRTASVNFNIYPQTAKVTVFKDDVAVGTTTGNGSVQLADGLYTYAASSPGFNTLEGRFRIDESRDTLVEDELGRYGRVEFDVGFSPEATPAPDASIVVINGASEICEEDTLEPGAWYVPAGEYRYIIKAEGYADKTGTFTVSDTPGSQQVVEAVLYANAVEYTFSIDVAGATMKLYDEETGAEVLPDEGTTYTLMPGKSYAYTVKRDGYLDSTGVVLVQGPDTLDIVMNSLSTTLTIEEDDLTLVGNEDNWYSESGNFNYNAHGNNMGLYHNTGSVQIVRFPARFILGGITDFEMSYGDPNGGGDVTVFLAPQGMDFAQIKTIASSTNNLNTVRNNIGAVNGVQQVIRMNQLPQSGGWETINSESVSGGFGTIQNHEGGYYDIYVLYGGDWNPGKMVFTLDENYAPTYDVTFNVTPADATFELNELGSEDVISPASNNAGVVKYTLSEGLYHYIAEKEGYITVEEVVFVGEGATLNFDVKLLPPPVVITGFAPVEGLVYDGQMQDSVFTGTPIFTEAPMARAVGDVITIDSPTFTDVYVNAAGVQSSTAPTDAGNYTLIRTLVHDDYSGTVEIPFTVAKKPVTISAEDYAIWMQYNGTTRGGVDVGGGTLSTTDILPQDSTVEPVVAFVGDYDSANAGEYEVDLNLALTGAGSSNYVLQVTQIPVEAEIEKKPLTAADLVAQAEYEDGTAHEGFNLDPKYTGLGEVKEITYVGVNGTTYNSSTPPTGEGEYEIQVKFEDGPNFTAPDAAITIQGFKILPPAIIWGGDGNDEDALDVDNAVGQTSVQINWTAAESNLNAGQQLKYYVFVSDDEFDLADGIPQGIAPQGPITDTSYTATGLAPETAYNFIVVVEDEEGNRRAYQKASATTTAADLTGTASIDNTTPQVGDVLTGKIDGANAADLIYTWKSGSTELGNGETYTVKAGDLGKAIYLEVTSPTKAGAVTSAATAAVVPQVIPATGIELDANDADSAYLQVGSSLQLNFAFTPSNTTATVTDLIFTSSNEAVAVVDAFGKVTAVGYGEATITVTLKGNNAVTATFKVSVQQPPVSGTQDTTQVATPQTGDDSNMVLWIVLLGAMVVVIAAGTWFYLRRRKNAGSNNGNK